MVRRSGWMTVACVLLGVLLLTAGCGKGDSAYQEGMKLAQDGEYEKALSWFQQAVKDDNKSAEYQIGYGMTYNYMGKYKEAGKVFENAMDKLKESASKEEKKQFYYGSAVAYYGQGEYEQAVSYCDKALEIDLLGDMDADIYFSKAACLENQGEYEEAEKVLKKLTEEEKKDWEAYYELAFVQRQQGKNEDAVKTYQKLIEDEEGDGSAHFALYELYRQMGEPDAADEVIEKVLQWNVKKASNALAVGRAYYYKKDFETARKFMEQAYDGNCTQSLFYLGILSLDEKDYQEAEKNFLSYMEECRDERRAEVYYLLASALMEQKDYKKAQDYLDEGTKHGALETQKDIARTQVILFERQNMYEEALEEAQEYVKRYPTDAGMKKELEFIKTRIK